MPAIVVCPLSRLAETVDAHGARHVVSLVNMGTTVLRPAPIAPERHLFLGVSDIVEPAPGQIAPAEAHVAALLDFVGGWTEEAPLVVHCWAGISRSTAAAFITACVTRPEVDERVIAARLRALSPTATPNARLVAVADDILARGGRLVDAVRSIGPGRPAEEGIPFRLTLPEGRRGAPPAGPQVSRSTSQ